jgi:hypothetical protein
LIVELNKILREKVHQKHSFLQRSMGIMPWRSGQNGEVAEGTMEKGQNVEAKGAWCSAIPFCSRYITGKLT